MDCGTPGLPVHHHLPEPAQTHVHQVSDAIQQSHPLSSPSLPALNLSQHQGLFQWVSPLHHIAKGLELQLQHQSSSEYSGMISFRTGWSDLLAVQGILKSLYQHHSSRTSIVWCSAFFMVQLTSIHDYWKNHSLDYTDLCCQSNVCFIICCLGWSAFLPKSKRLLMSWLQSPSAVILEPKKNKVYHCFHCFPIYLPWSDGTGCHDLSFMNVEF